MVLASYKKFCCGIFYLLKEKAKSDIPLFATFMFTLFLFVLLIFGLESLIYLLLKTQYYVSRYLVYLVVAFFAIPNYFFIFKDQKFLELYTEKLAWTKIITIVLLIFVCSLTLVLTAGVRIDAI